MNKQQFSNLLEDLFDIYNPVKKSNISYLVEEYRGREFDAIYTMYFKYNNPKFIGSLYDPNIGTRKHIEFLITSYSQDKRVLIDFKQEKLGVQEQVVVVEEPKINEEKIKEIENKIYIQLKKELLETLEQHLNKTEQKSISYEIEIDYTGMQTDLQLPKDIGDMPVNSRFIVRGSDGKPYGLEIKDVMYDFFSQEGKCVKQITIA